MGEAKNVLATIAARYAKAYSTAHEEMVSSGTFDADAHAVALEILRALLDGRIG